MSNAKNNPPPTEPKAFDENDRKYFDYLQAVITRMNTNSFAIKGWAIGLVTALLALATSAKDWYFLLIPAIPIFALWKLDSLYLEQEQKFSALYDAAVLRDKRLKVFHLKPVHKVIDEAKISSKAVFKSTSIIQFYLPLLIITLLICATGIICKIIQPPLPSSITISGPVKIEQVK